MQRLHVQASDLMLGPSHPLLTIPAVAKLLSVSRPTVYTLIDMEGLPIIKLGRSVRISPISLQKWLLEQEQEQGDSYGRE